MRTLPQSVLIAEDDADVQAFLRALLLHEGCTVHTANDGDEAVLIAVREQPDAIILDVMMPGKGGFEALKELRVDPRTAHIPVIMLTAVNDYELGVDHDRESTGRRLGVTPPEAFLEKPVRPDDLLEALVAAVEH
jgi:CheY-like chemotaxis protein